MKARIATLAAMSALAISAQQLPVEGLASSPVKVLIFEDLQCPDCADFRKMLDEKLLPRFAGKVAFIHRDFPLAKHAWARQAAVASRYFATIRPELCVEFRRATFARIPEIRKSGFETWLASFVKSHDLDLAKAKAALEDAALGAMVEKDFQEGVGRGVVKTPTAFVNGRPFIETFTFEEISAGIDQALAENK